MGSEQVIAAWTAAYEAANGPMPASSTMRYAGGWYSTGYNKFRRKQVEALTSALLARVAARATGEAS